MKDLSGTCIACGASGLRSILSIERVPVLCNQLCQTHDDALAAETAPIELAYCGSCGHVFNAAYDADRVVYGADYENSLHFSPRFRAYSTALVESLCRRHELGGKVVVEVGCGDGDFLRQLCATSGGQGHGFDPGYSGPTSTSEGARFSASSYFDAEGLPAPELLCCRQVLEHIDEPRGFVSAIAKRMRKASGAALYLEVPNSLYTLRDLGIWDIIYEHPSYFCPESLRRVVTTGGLDVVEVEETFGGQFLSLHATIGGGDRESSARSSEPRDVTALVERFAASYREKVRHWTATLAEAKAAGQRVAAWGAGSKGSSFLNVVDPGGVVDCIVDVNPLKHDRYISGTGHRIVAPEALREASYQMVILMNPLYEAEVRGTLDSVSPDAQILLA